MAEADDGDPQRRHGQHADERDVVPADEVHVTRRVIRGEYAFVGPRIASRQVASVGQDSPEERGERKNGDQAKLEKSCLNGSEFKPTPQEPPSYRRGTRG